MAAAQPTDITLDGAGYMLAPGSYKRAQDGTAEGRTGRIVMRDFFGGGRRPFQLERDRAMGGARIGPVYDGQGVWPWPFVTTGTLPSGAILPFRNTRIPAIAIDNTVYFGLKNQLYKTVAMDAATWSTPTILYSFAVDKQITGLFEVHGNIGCCLGTGQTTEVITPAGVYVSSIQGDKFTRLGVAYAGHVIMAEAKVGGATDRLWLTTSGTAGIEYRYLDAPIVNMGLWQGKVAIATRQSLWTFSGRTNDGGPGTPDGSWIGDPVPFHNDSWSEEWDDYPFLLGYGGHLYTWVDKEVVFFNPTGDRAGWKKAGLSGVRCYGACVTGGYLVVATESLAGDSELWAWDGAGWWLITRQPATEIRRIWPTALDGAGNFDLMVFRDGSLLVDLYRLIWRDDARHSLAQVADFASSMLDAGERDKDKAWRKVGAIFAAPSLHGAVPDASAVTCKLRYKTGPADNWTEVASATKTGNTLANANFTLDADLSSANAVSRFLQLQVTWNVGGGWAPILAGLWAEYETLDSPARRRKWSFVVAARDQTVDRAGAVLTRTGRQLIAELWAKWQAGSTLLFHDQDFDADPTERRVRIVGIEEAVAHPKDAGQWGEALVKLTLVEV